MLKKQLPFWLFSISVILALTLPVLIQDGMFLDAMLYTSVSKNLANGIGSFWFPVFSKGGVGGLPSFHEHPPLVFGIQSLFFKFLGNSMYTERIYVLITLFITAFLIVTIWKQIKKDSPEYYSGWIPLFFWIIIPVCFWSFSNNMQENTMGIFVLLSVCFYLKASENKSSIFYLIISASCIFLATFSKGLPGFFPIVTPFFYWICTKKNSFRKIFLHSFLLLLIPLLIYLVLFNLPESKESLSNYLYKRALLRIDQGPTVDSRFWIIGRLLSELIPPLGVVTILYFVFRKHKGLLFAKEHLLLPCFFLLLGLAGAAPLILTKVQKGFYFVPSLPFFAIGLSMLISKPLSEWSFKIMEGNTNRILTRCSIVLSCLVLIFSSFNIGKTSRDKDLLHDAYLIGKVVPENSTLSISEGVWSEWTMQCYLIRYFNISLDPSTKNKNDFMLVYKNSADTLPAIYKQLPLNTAKFDLYKIKK